MAKKKATKKTAKKKATGVSKSQAIRDQIKKSPDASANDIAAAASKQIREEVSPALVYNIKSAGGGAKKKGRKKKVAKRTPAPAVGDSGGGVNAALIKEAATLLQQAGGDPKAAKAALDLATEVRRIVIK